MQQNAEDKRMKEPGQGIVRLPLCERKVSVTGKCLSMGFLVPSVSCYADGMRAAALLSSRHL